MLSNSGDVAPCVDGKSDTFVANSAGEVAMETLGDWDLTKKKKSWIYALSVIAKLVYN